MEPKLGLDQLLVQSFTNFADVLYTASIAAIVILFFKDAVSDFVANLLIFLKMKWSKYTYTSIGGRVLINENEFIITDITVTSVYLKKAGNGVRMRYPIREYWNRVITYKDVEV